MILPYHRPRPAQPAAVSMEGDVGVYVIEKLLNRRQSRRGTRWCVEYLVRWHGYGPEFDVWYNVKDLDDAPELIKECDERLGLTKPSAVVGRKPDPPVRYGNDATSVTRSTNASKSSALTKPSTDPSKSNIRIPKRLGSTKDLESGKLEDTNASKASNDMALVLRGDRTVSTTAGKASKSQQPDRTAVTQSQKPRASNTAATTESKAIAVVIPKQSTTTTLEENKAVVVAPKKQS